MSGIRYLDLRVAKHDADGQLYFAHTMLGARVAPELERVSDYFHGRDREIVILDFQNLINFSPADHNSLLQMITTLFGDRLIPPTTDGKPTLEQTLEKLWAERKQLIVFYGDDDAAGSTARPKSFWPRHLLQSIWCEKMDLGELRGCLEDNITKSTEEALFLLQCILSPNVKDIAKLILKNSLLPLPLRQRLPSLQDLASMANPSIISWCESIWKNKGLNILMFDWYEYGDVVKASIRLATDGKVARFSHLVDGNVGAFQARDPDTVFVLSRQGDLWREHAPFGDGHVPPQREQVDGNVGAFQALDPDTVFILSKQGALWREHAPFKPPGEVPPRRELVDENVGAFQAINADTVFVVDNDGNLLLAQF